MDRRTLLVAAAAAPISGWLAAAQAHRVGEELAMRVASLPQGTIRYYQQGRGATALFIHGWPLNGSHWRPLMARVSSHRRCIAPDLMGLGHTEVPASQPLDPHAQARMLFTLMDALHIERADLVANDSGTCIAQLMAIEAPQRVRSLLLTNGDVDENSPPKALAPALQAAREGTLDKLLERHLAEPGFAQSPQGLGGLCYTHPDTLDAAAMARYFLPLLATPLRRRQFQQYGVAFEPNPLRPCRDAIARLPMPARMVWGTADIHFPVATAHWLDRMLPGSRGVREVPGAKLFFTEEFPHLLADEAMVLWEGGRSV